MQPSISLIITAYNEAPIIKDCVQTCIDSLDTQFTDYEIILINDASIDNTGQIMDKLALEYQHIICQHNPVNVNMGTSIQRGMLIATKDYVTFNAADLPFDPSNYIDIINQAPNADMIVVERIKYEGTTKSRRILSKLNRVIMHILFPRLMRNLHDTNYFQITRRSILPSIMPKAQDPIFTWPEMIFRARHAGMNVMPIKAEYKPKHERKGAFGKPRDILWGLCEMLHFRWLLWFGKVSSHR